MKVLRWLHLVFAVPLIGYAYSPFSDLPSYAPQVRFVFAPALVITGLSMWIGGAYIRRKAKVPA